MPAIIKVKVIDARDLPVMDRASDLTDAFVELRLGNTLYKTEVYRKSLNPYWDSEWFKFEVDDEELQEEILQVKVLDYDVYSAHDAIGKVNINLDIFAHKAGSNEMSGMFPIYDTIHGIRGHIRLKVKVQFFMDTNKYRQTSCGVQMFNASSVPHGYVATQVQGLVDELLVNDDPEYQWIDKIRTPRASNEARQRLFSKLSGEVKRKIGMKVLELGGNAVIGYQQQFDLEGETGIIVRAIGTAVTLLRESDTANTSLLVAPAVNVSIPEVELNSSVGSVAWRRQRSHEGSVSEWRGGCVLSPEGGENLSNKPIFNEFPDPNSKVLPTLHKGISRKGAPDAQDYPFFTFTTPPPGFIVRLGGVVSSRSVKLLDKINNPDDSDARDSWWNELRVELRSHAKAMGCHAVVGYSEYTSICDDLIVLSVYGTAAIIKSPGLSPNLIEICNTHETNGNGIHHGSTDRLECYNEDIHTKTPRKHSDTTLSMATGYNPTILPSCNVCHIPYSEADLPLPIIFSRCAFCRAEKVPDVLFSTTDIPDELPITGSGCMIQARVIRCRKKEKGEVDAENVSQILPFLEFNMHQQLLNKLKLKGMNAIFGVKTKLCIGEQVIIGIMTGTAVFLTALPPPPMLTVSSSSDVTDAKRLTEIRRKLMEINKGNLHFHNIKEDSEGIEHRVRGRAKTEVEGGDIQGSEKLDLFADGKNAFVLEVDDTSDANILPLLSDSNYEGFNIFNTQTTPGFPILKHAYQYLSVFNRIKVPIVVDDDLKTSHWLSYICDSLIMGIRLKTRMMRPCCLTKTSFDIDIDDDDNFQITISTFACEVDECFNKPAKQKRFSYSRSRSLSSETSNEATANDDKDIPCRQGASMKSHKPKKIDLHGFHSPPVTICPLDNVPNTQVLSYIGNVSLFLIRESMSMKEDGGLHLFMQQFVCEIHAIIRSHVLALGGNAILSFSLNEIILCHNTHKNHASCLINVSGDAACIKKITDTSGNLICLTEMNMLDSESPTLSLNLGQSKEVLVEMQHKLDRAVTGTNV